MVSKYDVYWVAQLHEIRAAVQLAAAGSRAAVAVPDLRRLGARRSWYGVAEVRGREVTRSSGAHGVSLGRTVAATSICVPWTDQTFRFTISAVGMLTIVTAEGGAARALRPASNVRRQADSPLAGLARNVQPANPAAGAASRARHSACRGRRPAGARRGVPPAAD